MPTSLLTRLEDWRDVPLLTALSVGAASVEADVWFINGSLFVSYPSSYHSISKPVDISKVGHELGALTPDRTFELLYVAPLLRILEMQNPQTQFTAGSSSIK